MTAHFQSDAIMGQLRVEVIDRIYAGILSNKTPAERAAMIADCQRSAIVVLAAGERLRHPDWSEEQISVSIAKRLLDGAN